MFHELRYNLVIDSILAGNTPAWVFVDNPAKPKSSLIWNKQETLLLSGDSGNEAFNQDLRDTVSREIIPDANMRQIPEIALHYHSKIWAKVIIQMFSPMEPTKTLRRYYNFDRPKFNWRSRIPEGDRILPMSQPVLQNQNLNHIQDMTGGVKSYWHSFNDFLNRGFGYCLVQGDEILSWCFSVYASGRDYELELATHNSHQGKDYGTLVAAACVEHCNQQDLNPHWHCWNDNLLSIKIAEKVGFENPVKYPVYRLQVKTEN